MDTSLTTTPIPTPNCARPASARLTLSRGYRYRNLAPSVRWWKQTARVGANRIFSQASICQSYGAQGCFNFVLSLDADEVFPREGFHHLEQVSLFQAYLGANGGHKVRRHEKFPSHVRIRTRPAEIRLVPRRRTCRVKSDDLGRMVEKNSEFSRTACLS